MATSTRDDGHATGTGSKGTNGHASDANGSPVFGGSTVWVPGVDSGNLYALNPLNGGVRQSLQVGHMRHFTTPTIFGQTLLVATDTTVQAFRHA